MIINDEDLKNMESRYRAHLINALSGIRQAVLLGTRSNSGQSNLAIFNSLVHIGANPPYLGCIFRPVDEVRRHSYLNINETGHYTFNHLPEDRFREGHQTSAKYPDAVSEFDACGFTELYLDDFPAPFVKEAAIRVGLEKAQEVPLLNGTLLVIGSIRLVSFNEELLDPEGHMDLEQAGVAGVCGLDTYYRLKKIETLGYARP